MAGECVARVVGGAVRKADEATITTHFYARHHEWRYYVNPLGDGFYCAYCLALSPFPAAAPAERGQ